MLNMLRLPHVSGGDSHGTFSLCGPGWLGSLPRVCVTMDVVGWRTRGAYLWELKFQMVVGAVEELPVLLTSGPLTFLHTHLSRVP